MYPYLKFFFYATDSAPVILDEEPDVGSGMAAALKLAMSKGYLEKEEKKRIVVSKAAQELQAQRYTIEDKATYDSQVFYGVFIHGFETIIFFNLGKTISIQGGIDLMVQWSSSKIKTDTSPSQNSSISTITAKL